jgi:cytochrome c biogenesis protein CcmG, thiol:disulfide interchange protein DsbE
VRLSLSTPLLSAVLLPLLFAAGCSRGQHPTDINKPAPDFTIVDGSRTVSLSEYRGKVVVLNFWASWCPPCLEEFPSLMQLQKEMPNVVVLAVSFDTDPSAYRHYLTEHQITGIVTAVDPSQKSNLAFGTSRPPESYIIDQRGVIRRKFIGVPQEAQEWVNPEILGFLSNLETGKPV